MQIKQRRLSEIISELACKQILLAVEQSQANCFPCFQYSCIQVLARKHASKCISRNKLFLEVGWRPTALLPCLILSRDSYRGTKGDRDGTIKALTLLKLPVRVVICVRGTRQANRLRWLEEKSRFTDSQIRVSVSLPFRKGEHDTQQIYPMNQKGEDEGPGFRDKKPTAHRARARRNPGVCGKSRALQISIANERSLSQCVFTWILQGLLWKEAFLSGSITFY